MTEKNATKELLKKRKKETFSFVADGLKFHVRQPGPILILSIAMKLKNFTGKINGNINTVIDVIYKLMATLIERPKLSEKEWRNLAGINLVTSFMQELAKQVNVKQKSNLKFA